VAVWVVTVGAGVAVVVAVEAGIGADGAACFATGWWTGRCCGGLGDVFVVVVAGAAARVAVVLLLLEELELAAPHPATPRASPQSTTSERSLGVMVFS
jgi:hypothetical protein